MKPDFLYDVFGFRDAAGPSGEEPDKLAAMGREDCRKACGLDRVGVGYGSPPKVIGTLSTMEWRGARAVYALVVPLLPMSRRDVAPKIACRVMP